VDAFRRWCASRTVPSRFSIVATPAIGWGDLLVGRYGRSHLVTLVERHSRYLLALPLPDATTTSVVAAVTSAFQHLPERMRSSLTWDRGVEMAQHQRFTIATGVQVHLCIRSCLGSAAPTRTL
jgi:transposase, IS30 family